METIAAYPIMANRVADDLREAAQKLDGASAELVLDFAGVGRVDAGALRCLEDLAVAAESKSVKVGLRNVNVEIYKVLKLVKLAPRFLFLS